MARDKSILIYGFGNPGRLDDGLGPAFAEAIEQLNLPGINVDSNYQLAVEDALLISQYETVFFVDADVSCDAPFNICKLEPSRSPVSFSSHSVRPEGLLSLSRELFNARTNVYLLGIRGYEFNEYGEYLSDKAKTNMEKAINRFKETLLNNTLLQNYKICEKIDKKTKSFEAQFKH